MAEENEALGAGVVAEPGEAEDAGAAAAAPCAAGVGVATEPAQGVASEASSASEDARHADPTGENAASDEAKVEETAGEKRELTAEERELAENNALADVFDDVRKQSANSALVTPDRWVEQGIVPDHMTADEFEMLVYEHLENYRREHKDEIEQEKRERAAKRNSVRSATRAVGVPPKIPNRRLAQIEADEKAKEAAEEGKAAAADEAAVAATQGDSASAPAEALAVDEPSLVVDAGQAVDAGAAPEQAGDAAPEAASAASQDDDADSDDPFAGLKIPEGYKLVELEGEYVLVPDENAKPVRKEIHCEHIVTLVGQHSYYLYDSDLMTKNYAHWSFLSAEDNPLATFVDCVREEGRVYPRPLSESDLANEPFRMSAAKVEETWAKLVETGEYPDIERCEASNGDVYFFSTLYMSRVLAESLAEYESVERKANV